jgi:beta-galactosidase
MRFFLLPFSILLICLFHLFQLHADETVYNKKEISLATINNEVFGTIIKKPFTERYKLTKNASTNKWFQVDIRKACNMGFKDAKPDDNRGGWTDSGPVYDLDPFGLGYGMVKLYGVPFRIIDPAVNNNKSMITMRSGWKTDKYFPEQVTIPVNRQARALYFFHSGSYAATHWGMGASRRYEVVYSDGTKIRIPLICAGGHENIGNWMWNPSGSVPLLDTSSAKPVPVNIGNATRYLFTLEWLNPFSGKKIKEIKVVSTNDKKWFTVVVLGITGLK